MTLSKASIVVMLIAVLVATNAFASMDRLDAPVREMINEASGADLLPVIVLMSERPDIQYLESLVKDVPRNDRSDIVWNELDALASDTQADLLEVLSKEEQKGRAYDITSLRICNGISLKADAGLIREISDRADVYMVIDDERQKVLPDPIVEQGGEDELDEIVWGVLRIDANDVWSQGYTGEGVIVAMVDSGINYNHWDLQSHMWYSPSYPNHGYDFENNDNNPIDDNGHGTHTAGTVASDGTAGSQCGVAPDATLMALKTIDAWGYGYRSNTWDALDFALQHGADVLSMSLGWIGETTTQKQTWRQNFDALNAGGVISCVAAGNERGYYNPPDAVRTPGNVPSPWRNPDEDAIGGRGGVITVGATNSSDLYAYFSSNGPVTWDNVPGYYDWGNPYMLCPDVAAPGTDTKSCDYQDNNGYISGWAGTSMATPHVAGTVALMLSKNMNLTPAEVDEILQTTAYDRGPAGKDNDYGAGRIRALDAVNAVQTGPGGQLQITLYPVNPPIVVPSGGGSFQFDVTLENTGGAAVTFDAWTELTLPNGNPYGPLILVENITLGAGQQMNPATQSQFIPWYAPSGTYTYNAMLGTYPGTVDASDSFTFSKSTLAAGEQVDNGWEASDWFAEQSVTASEPIPAEFSLQSVYPNPFNPSTTVTVALPVSADLNVMVYNINGQLVSVLANGNYAEGFHHFTLDGGSLASGMYFISATVPGKMNEMRKVMLMK